LERHTEGIGDRFRVTKNRRKARAVILSHQFGWEVRLLIGSREDWWRVASLPHPGRSTQYRRTMEKRHD
jgi:hypothetical protein